MTDRFRGTYRSLSPEETQDIEQLKVLAAQMAEVLRKHGPCRESSLATTKLEEAVMWGVKGISRDKGGAE